MIKKNWYQLPDDQCERLNRTEMVALKWLIAAVNSCAYGQEDMERRLECIPEGKRRYRLMLGQLRAICNDLIGTMPRKQAVTIKNTMNDMELRLVPKFSGHGNRVTLDIDDLSYIVNAAKKDHCLACILNGDECRSCKLYQILESIAPMEDWGDSTVCPYMREDWLDR